MAANSYDFGVNLRVNADTKQAQQHLKQLHLQLGNISNMKINFSGLNSLTSEINRASSAATILQKNLEAALNPQTGNLNFSKFNAAITGAGQNIDGLAQSLLTIGPQGSQAFTSLANSIAKSEVPLMRTNSLVNGLWMNLKKTAGWQLSSSMIHGFIGGVQQAVGYAKALDQSLTNIRIVTGQSADQMAKFAREANAAAKRLSTTTTDYTNASLIYYQQGLSDAEVKKRADVTLKMANVSGQTAEKVADQMTAIWNNFDDGTKSMEHYADVMTALGAATASSSQEIAKGIQKFSAISETVGLSYEYAASALATITATTRESADTVGNSLKTLFSRIQGLQLGDTLDDGTTLNKYSTALAKVGISIKDASGALKDMDTILDDMGSKWHTLAEDQKMALAQTVGGVRQYTQIMTLMENWEFFKSNLNVAEGSAGTLQKQADIFEDSWLGAQKRMKASWENLWDTLIDSEGFKKVLNIGSTIVDSMTKAFAGLGGMGGIFSGGVLGFSGSLLGNLFKSQLSNSVDNVFYNFSQLNPNARAAAEAKRTDTVKSMAESIRDPFLNPSMGDMQRNITADNVINVAQERMAYARVSQYLRPEEQAMYEALNTRAAALSEQQEQAAGRIDRGKTLIERGRLANEDNVGFYTDSTSWTRDPSADKKGGGMRASNFAAALFQEGVKADGTSTQSISSVLTNFGQRSVTAQEQFGNFQTWLTDGKKPGQDGAVFDYNKLLTKDSQGRYKGEAFDTFADLYGLNSKERGLINGQSVAQLRDSGNYRLADIKRNLDADMSAISQAIVANKKQTDPAIRASAVTAVMEQRRANAENTLVKGLTEGQGAKKGVNSNAVKDMLEGSKEVARGQRVYDAAGKEKKGVEEDRNAIANKQITPGRTVVSGALGLSSTSTAISSAEGAINSLMSGNFLGFASGVGSAAMNMRMGAQNYAEMFQGFSGIGAKLGESGKKAELLEQQAKLQLDLDRRKQLTDVRKQLKATDLTDEKRNELLLAEEALKAGINKGSRKKAQAELDEVNKSLEKMSGVRASSTLGKIAPIFDSISKHAQQFSGALQAAQITMKIVNSALNYMYNENQRNATNASKASAELNQAYTMNQKNHAQLLANIETYDKATSKLSDTALQGVAYNEAVYQQNRAANELIGKYNLKEEDYSRVGDQIIINERALKDAEEKSIQNMAVSKYAADIQKVKAREANNIYQEETLERTLSNEGIWKTGITAAAAIGAGAMALFLPATIPVLAATAVGIASGAAGGIIAGTVAESIYDSLGQDSAIDKAKELIRETGSTKWMDEEGAAAKVGLSESKFEELKENRDDLEDLVNNEDAAERQRQAVYENTARDILNNNEETEDFKYKNKLTEGVANVYEEEAEIQKGDKLGWWNTKDEKIREAELLKDELGLSGKDNLTWVDDQKGKRLTYSYMENGQQITGHASYETLAQMKANARAKEASDQYIAQQKALYEEIKTQQGEVTASGMLSFISGGDFDTATKGEMDAAQAYMQDILGGYDAISEKWGDINNDVKENLAKILQLDTTNQSADAALSQYALQNGFKKVIDYDDMGNEIYGADINKLIESVRNTATTPASIFELMEKDFAGETGKYKEWFQGEGKEIYASMDQATMKEFYKELSFLGGNASSYLSSLTGMIDGVNPNRVGELMSALTSVDWSDWSGLETQVIQVLDEFGVELTTENDYLREFIRTIQDTAKAIPNLTEQMESLSQVSGKLGQLKLGDSIDKSTMEAFAAQNIDLKDYTFSTWSGDNILNKDTEDLKKVSREKESDAYWAYMDQIDAVKNAFGYTQENEWSKDARKDWLNENLLGYTRDEFLDFAAKEGTADNLSHKIAEGVLGEDSYQNMVDAYNQLNSFKKDETGWYTEDSAGNKTYYSEKQYEDKYNQLNDTLDNYFNIVKFAAEASMDPTELSEIGEVLTSTYGSYDEALQSDVVRDMINNKTLSQGDIATYYALINHKDALADDIEAYTYAVENLGKEEQETALAYLEQGIAVQDALKNYKDATGKKIGMAEFESAKEDIKEELAKETVGEGELQTTKDQLYSDAELTKLTEESIIAGNAEQFLEKRGNALASEVANMDGVNTKGLKAAAQLGKYMQQFLGLTEYNIQNIGDESRANPIVDAIKDLKISISKIIAGDTAEAARLRLYLIQQSQAGQSLTNKLKINAATNRSEDYVLDDWGRPTKQLSKKGQAYNNMAEAYEDGNLEEFKEAAAVFADQKQPWEEYNAGVSMASGGTMRAKESGNLSIKSTFGGKEGTTSLKYQYDKTMGQMMYQNLNKGQTDAKGNVDNRDWVTREEAGVTEEQASSIVDAEGKPKRVGGGGRGGGGGGGPTKVAVKSAQELMTRYKTIDAKSAIAEMQKATALTQKDLLYGEAKIAQLQKINGLLVKQQKLTADRIEEERQYLAEDKKHLQEVLDRYNKDKKDKDGKLKEGEELLELEFNSEGIITNYKQTVGAMAEELAAFYRDGELTSEEGKKAEELQKKIDDLNVVIQDYEDSLTQLQTSIDTYEQTLYEMFANQAEELAYKVTYKLEMENDDLTYVKFYATALKESTDRMYDYIDLIGQQAGEFKDQIEVYNQGVEDLISNAENNPMYTFATGGLEGVLTAEDVTNLRTYRDGLNTTYTSMVALRKEVEDKVLKVFDEWHDKVNKNVNSISRYTDMLGQFKDVINVIGKETLGLSDAFMKNFEQKSIDQSRDNIEATKQQYESLAEIYANAQDKLEAARADGNEETIKHWEAIVDKTQSEMESAQDAILTTLNHTLNLIAEQFTNAINEAIDTFNESIYEFGGLDGLISDYEQIREQRDLMVEDYEKIYTLNKLNRQIEKTLDDTKIIAGKQKLLEFQEKINDLNKNNVELSKFELEYLQAEYELRLAEIELENARTAKDTVRLSRDSEGNWSYIYTQNESAIDEAQQKYEDALYKMQQTTQEYQNEMSTSMMEVAQKMRDEIAALNIQELGPEKFQEEMDRIKEKYAEQLAFYENELNKSISTSKNLYDEDWQNYSAATGYKLSAAQDWADQYGETTLGGLMGSGQYMSDYAAIIMNSADTMTESMAKAATTYFNESNKALETYGTSISGFAGHLQTTTDQITASSKKAAADVTTMAKDMVDAFAQVADEVKNWQDTFGEEISMLLDEIGNKIQEINDLIEKSNELGKKNYTSTDLIGQAEAIELIGKETFNNKDLFGTWTFDEENGVARGTYTDASGEVQEDVERNLVEFTGQLVEMIDELTGKYYDSRTGSAEREQYGEQIKRLFQDYWKFKNIVNRIYDITDISLPEPKLDKDKVEKLDTGGYTGEWGTSGKLAFLHEKELVLNKDDTANFLEALNISKQLVEMIEMNAKQSSLGLGEMFASTIKDTTQTIEQQVSITAEFPNATDHSEIEEAFDNLINMASQYAYRN